MIWKWYLDQRKMMGNGWKVWMIRQLEGTENRREIEVLAMRTRLVERFEKSLDSVS